MTTDEDRRRERAQKTIQVAKKIDAHRAEKFIAGHVMRWDEFRDNPVTSEDNHTKKMRYIVMFIMELKAAVNDKRISGPDAYKMFEAKVEELDLGHYVPTRIVGPPGPRAGEKYKHEFRVSEIFDDWFRADWFKKAAS